MKKIKFVLVFIVGIIIGLVLSNYLMFSSSTSYVMLNKDYTLENGSLIKKGTKIKIDYGFSEGFTRYIVYINAKRIDGQVEKFNYHNYCIPYWIK